MTFEEVGEMITNREAFEASIAWLNNIPEVQVHLFCQLEETCTTRYA